MNRTPSFRSNSDKEARHVRTKKMRSEKLCTKSGRVKNLLRIGVMTSSSERHLKDLFREVKHISSVETFDLILVRRPELIKSGVVTSQELESRFRRMSDIVADDENFSRTKATMIEDIRRSGVQISAIATYFPDITATSKNARDAAIKALFNSMQFAIELCNRGLMNAPIVEMVCGSLVDPDPKEPAIRIVSNRNDKLRLLFSSMMELITAVRQKFPKQKTFGFALELEPGETYVVNDAAALDCIDSMLIDLEKSNHESRLYRHVGFNLDIAHMRIAGVSAKRLRPFLKRFVHAHISDHPGMHTHDQIVGSWTSPAVRHGGYTDYIRLLNERASGRKTAARNELPFSNTIAIELEGCNRIFWIHDSITRLRHAILASSF